MNDVTFSIIIPAYNREEEIKRAINSVLNQTYDDYEIVVVDDGSTDNTESVVKSIKDDRIKYIKQANSGATVARNTGIAHAIGTYVSFLDSDDEWLPTMLENQKSVYDSDSEISFVYANVQMVYPDGKKKPFGKRLGIHGNIYPETLAQGYLAPTTVLSAKRECFQTIGGFDISLPASQDDDICFKLTKEYKCGYINEVMAYMYSGPNNRISRNRKKVALGWWMLWNKYEKDVLMFCGKDIMCLHYFHCAVYFSQAGESEYLNLAIEKIHSLGGVVPQYRLFLLRRMLKASGVMKRVYFRLLRSF